MGVDRYESAATDAEIQRKTHNNKGSLRPCSTVLNRISSRGFKLNFFVISGTLLTPNPVFKAISTDVGKP